MIKDVKSYFQAVASRLSNAFRMESFETSDELEFWALATDYLSHEDPPSFKDIVDWVDRLYNAPVHFIYRKEKDEKLVLFKRLVKADNIVIDVGEIEDNFKEAQKETRSKLRGQLEEQLQNLEYKISFTEDFLELDTSSFSIGECEHIPLFHKGDFWGVYCAGPYTRSPESVTPKFSIIGRILTSWFIELEKRERSTQQRYEAGAAEKIEKLGTGTLNTKGISDFLIRYLAESTGATTGAIFQWSGTDLKRMVHYPNDQPAGNLMTAMADREFFTREGKQISLSVSGKKAAEEAGIRSYHIFSPGSETIVFLLFDTSEESEKSAPDDDLTFIMDTQQSLASYEKANDEISERLVETYYIMLRRLEKKRQKTAWHTPRMMALADEFSGIFGLDESEKKQLLLTAKLHDIGYVASDYIDKKPTVGAELQHPFLGEMMIEQLKIPADVKEGIKTHHEWLNGSGTPQGLGGEDIPWTGKIIGILEFMVEFIEQHCGNESKSGEERIEQLTEELINRADEQFDMVLIPSFVELINSLGWEQCCQAGVE